MKSLLFLFHCESNTGYAIGRLENVFFEAAKKLTANDYSRIHFGYPSMTRGPSLTIPKEFNNYLIIDTENQSTTHISNVRTYIDKNNIDTILGFDQPVHRPLYKHLRKSGVELFLSYYGAPMSSLHSYPKLFIKQLECKLRRHGPDHFIFESKGMAKTAYKGRGVPKSRTHLLNLGVDTEHFSPAREKSFYAHNQFNIPCDRKIFFFSGHMEPRKGIAVIMNAAIHLTAIRKQQDWHFLLLGNTDGVETQFLKQIENSNARDFVTFGGYRDDVAKIHKSCYAGIIASTGWDSFTCSSLEIQSSGLPLLVSDLPGLREAIEDQNTGFRFRCGDGIDLADKVTTLLNQRAMRDKLAYNSRQRILSSFTIEKQINGLVTYIQNLKP